VSKLINQNILIFQHLFILPKRFQLFFLALLDRFYSYLAYLSMNFINRSTSIDPNPSRIFQTLIGFYDFCLKIALMATFVAHLNLFRTSTVISALLLNFWGNFQINYYIRCWKQVKYFLFSKNKILRQTWKTPIG
jgi:hypothetical protein